MQSIVEKLINPENVGKIGIETITWENDGDHYKCEVTFFDSEEAAELAMSVVMAAKQDYINKHYHRRDAHKGFKILGREFEDLEEALLVLDSEEELDKRGFYISDIVSDLIGYEYESDRLRTLESYKLFKLVEPCKLKTVIKIEV